MFTDLFHADWSTGPEKRWSARAKLSERGWTVFAPVPVPASPKLVDELLAASGKGPVLAGFDFPIGVPESYGHLTGLPNFPSALNEFGRGRWRDFYVVSESASDIAIERPFYPRRSSAEAKQIHLLRAHGADSMDHLRRRCERATEDRRAACSLFWTLGGNQVGKAAIAGWQEVVAPARARGAHLWPFDGQLSDLAQRGGLTIAETYPAEAYGHVGVLFRAGESTRRREDRASKAQAILSWGMNNAVRFSPAMEEAITGGFGNDAAGEDRFDAALGLLGMIEVVTGRRSEGPSTTESRQWEGWILGQAGDAHRESSTSARAAA